MLIWSTVSAETHHADIKFCWLNCDPTNWYKQDESELEDDAVITARTQLHYVCRFHDEGVQNSAVC